MSSATQVDPRGLRAAAGVTALVLALVLVLPSPANLVLLGVQVVVFAWATFAGVAGSPYGIAYARLIRPRLAPPNQLEDARPPRFAQAVGLAFTGVALVAFVAGATTFGLIATALALVAALLNAAVGFCLGCEIYLALRRFTPVGA